MLTRRLLSNSSNPSKPASTFVARALSTSSAKRRVPALADLTPNNAAAFDTRSAKFREQVKEAQKAKEKQDSQSVARSPSLQSLAVAASSRPLASDAADHSERSSASSGAGQDDVSKMALGSLSTHDPGAQRDAQSAQESSKRKGKLSNLIYGTHEGQQMDHEIERSFSQVLARGKYVHSIVFHTVKPDRVDEYVEVVGGWYPRMAAIKENHVHLVGSWRTEVGDCDTFGASTKEARSSDTTALRNCGLTNDFGSSHLGISALSRLPRFST